MDRIFLFLSAVTLIMWALSLLIQGKDLTFGQIISPSAFWAERQGG